MGLPYNWVMNVPLIISVPLGIYYLNGLIEDLKNPVEKVGALMFGPGLAFLAGIGVFPKGTGPHYYVSWDFFMTASVGMLVIGMGLYLSGDKSFGLLTFLPFAG